MAELIDEFGIFADEEEGPMWRSVASHLDEAKRVAQNLADQEGIEFFVFRFRTASVVARCFPDPRRGKQDGQAED